MRRAELAVLAACCLLACAGSGSDERAAASAAARAQDAPAPRNSSLSNGLCPLVHCDAYQTDAFSVLGPTLPARALGDAEIDLLWGSPISGGVLDVTYPDGTTVFWVPKVDRIWKLGLDSNLRLVLLAELMLPTGPKYPAHSGEFMQAWLAELEALPFAGDAYRAKASYWRDYQLEALHAYYAVVDAEGVLFVGGRDRIVAYADVEPGNPRSPIVKRGELVFDPAQMNGGPPVLIGLNATFDGTLVAASLDGTLVAVDRALSRAVYQRLPGERFWNSIAVDEQGGIYAVSDKRLHKVVWTGQTLSTRAEDGAWSEPYEVGEYDAAMRGSRGSGTTPTLLGLESDRDQFVLIADAANVNNLVLYWRDAIPEDWEAIEGTPTRRIAGKAAVDFGQSDVTDSYSENSPVALGYGAAIANNRPRNRMPLHLDNQLWINEANTTPLGVQKFVWDPKRRRFGTAWVRPDFSFPSSTPAIAAHSRELLGVTVQDGAWALAVLDWDTGATRAVYPLGPSQRFNPIQLSLQLMGNGDPIYSTFAGVLHLKIGASEARSEPEASGVTTAGEARSEPEASGVTTAGEARSEPEASGVTTAGEARSEPEASGGPEPGAP
jgi:hypothetical protein